MDIPYESYDMQHRTSEIQEPKGTQNPGLRLPIVRGALDLNLSHL